MVNYLEILRLSSFGYSQRTIGSTARCSRHTIRSVLQAAQASGIAWPLDKDVTNAGLERMLFPDKHTGFGLYAQPDYAYIHRELVKPGVTMALLWEEYCRKCHASGETPYMSTQFGDKYRRWARVTKATMRIQRKPGDAIILKAASGSPVSEAMMDRIIHNAYEALIEGRVSMRERSRTESGEEDG